jgi:2C-methyl-D-erythritol 2,4-cyclodiphosphate synthase
MKENLRILKAGSTQQVQATLLAEREEMQEEIFRLQKTLRIALNAEQQAVNIPKKCHFLLKPVSRTRITKVQF